ncbi:site-specific tyrosine recombinase XerD [Cohnella nanjingensis]|uniref:Tyrosine recombinase XerC n=1 Tax=Cohnella nanjingensis TaxID=1387779 RepID=A0A7X0VI70_9BACL|nr:site-specific tyrosine recombinase XerD [Cohnella nanjingensis]MBB6674213.1 site-specific tyrosine recombinase XerD [Cohnella nanjingensis]
MKEEIAQFADHLMEAKRLSPHTLDGYRRDLEDLARTLAGQGIAQPEQVRPYHLSSYVQQLRRMNRSPATISRRIVSIRAWFRYLQVHEGLAINPALQLEAPKLERTTPRALTIAGVERLLEAPDTRTPAGVRDRTMLEVLYATGMRVSELVSLDRTDVRTQLGIIACRGTGGKERMIPIGTLCCDWMVKYTEEARPALTADKPDTDALFVNQHGNRMTRQGFWKLIKKHAVAAGADADVTPHTLRHSFAVHLLEGGADLRAVQEMMGHADLSATLVYRTAAKSRLKDVYEQAHPRSRRKAPDEDR